MGFVEKIRHDRVALIRTVVVYLNFLFYAAAIVVPGVSLLDLEIRIQEPFSVTSRLISLHLIGYFLGSILGECLVFHAHLFNQFFSQSRKFFYIQVVVFLANSTDYT